MDKYDKKISEIIENTLKEYKELLSSSYTNNEDEKSREDSAKKSNACLISAYGSRIKNKSKETKDILKKAIEIRNNPSESSSDRSNKLIMKNNIRNRIIIDNLNEEAFKECEKIFSDMGIEPISSNTINNNSKEKKKISLAWECPRCHKINSPYKQQCDCKPSYNPTNFNITY